MSIKKCLGKDESPEEYYRYISRNPCLFRAAFPLVAFGAILYTAVDLIAKVF